MTWSTRRSVSGLIGTLATVILSLAVSPAYASDVTPGSTTPTNQSLPSTIVEPVLDPARGPIINPAAGVVDTPVLTSQVVVVSAKAFTARAGWAYKLARAAAPSTKPGFYKTIWYARWYGKQVAIKKYHWGEKQNRCLTNLWNAESSWRYKASGGRGRYLGIPQMYKGNLRTMGINLTTFMKTPELQIQIGEAYIKGRYGSPCRALTHFNRKHWY